MPNPTSKPSQEFWFILEYRNKIPLFVPNHRIRMHINPAKIWPLPQMCPFQTSTQNPWNKWAGKCGHSFLKIWRFLEPLDFRKFQKPISAKLVNEYEPKHSLSESHKYFRYFFSISSLGRGRKSVVKCGTDFQKSIIGFWPRVWEQRVKEWTGQRFRNRWRFQQFILVETWG